MGSLVLRYDSREQTPPRAPGREMAGADRGRRSRRGFRDCAGKIELVTGGPPCQPFSLGGKHRAHGDARDMWPEAVRVVREIKPRAFIFENVKGLTRESFATYLAYIVHQLTFPESFGARTKPGKTILAAWTPSTGRRRGDHSLSYRVVHRVLNAANYGIPQRRERIVFVGFQANSVSNGPFRRQPIRATRCFGIKPAGVIGSATRRRNALAKWPAINERARRLERPTHCPGARFATRSATSRSGV